MSSKTTKFSKKPKLNIVQFRAPTKRRSIFVGRGAASGKRIATTEWWSLPKVALSRRGGGATSN